MKTNLIVAFLVLSPLFGYVVLSSCAPQQASYGPIKRDAATGARRYTTVAAPATTTDSAQIEQAYYMMNTVLTLNTKAVPCTCDPSISTSKNHN